MGGIIKSSMVQSILQTYPHPKKQNSVNLMSNKKTKISIRNVHRKNYIFQIISLGVRAPQMSVLPQDSFLLLQHCTNPWGYQSKSNLGYQSKLCNITLKSPLITGQPSKQLPLIGSLCVLNPVVLLH